MHELSLEDISRDCDIFIYHIDDVSFKNGDSLSIDKPVIARFCLVDIKKNSSTKVRNFNISTNNDYKVSIAWVNSFLEEKSQKIDSLITCINENFPLGYSELFDFSLDNFKNLESIMKIQWFDMIEILKQNPVNNNNIEAYNKISRILIDNQKYDVARIALLDIVKKYKCLESTWLNLADAEWGLDYKDDAKKSYHRYINLMVKENEKMRLIPQRVYERL